MSVMLTYQDIRHPDFPKAMRKLAECSDIKNVGILLRIFKAYKAVADAEKECLTTLQKLLAQYGTRKEDGNFEILQHDEYKKAADELMAVTFEIDGEPLKFNDIVAAKLCAVDIHALGPLIQT
jgi:hypothetical protein